MKNVTDVESVSSHLEVKTKIIAAKSIEFLACARKATEGFAWMGKIRLFKYTKGFDCGKLSKRLKPVKLLHRLF